MQGFGLKVILFIEATLRMVKISRCGQYGINVMR